jgi:hypothetical protein
MSLRQPTGTGLAYPGQATRSTSESLSTPLEAPGSSSRPANPPPGRTPVEPFFTARDYVFICPQSYVKDSVEVCVMSAAPTSDGEVVNGFQCNDVVEVKIKVTDSSGKSLMALYNEYRRRLDAAIKEAVESGAETLVGLEVHEGSLWVNLKIKVKQAYAWMKQAGSETLRWMRNNKEQIDFWIRTINNLLNIITNIVRILGWVFGGGIIPGMA